MLAVQHFYHFYVNGFWSVPVTEHVAALKDSGLPGKPLVGFVGDQSYREAAQDWLAAELSFDVAVEADSGFEQVTLQAVRLWAQSQPADAAVLYAHTKGTTVPGLLETVWRRAMTGQLVAGWQDCVKLLEDHDAVGCHWLTPHEYPGKVTSPFFGGNFWWARAGYLAALPVPLTGSRFDAEMWIGLGNPRVCDLMPGWPDGKYYGV